MSTGRLSTLRYKRQPKERIYYVYYNEWSGDISHIRPTKSKTSTLPYLKSGNQIVVDIMSKAKNRHSYKVIVNEHNETVAVCSKCMSAYF